MTCADSLFSKPEEAQCAGGFSTFPLCDQPAPLLTQVAPPKTYRSASEDMDVKIRKINDMFGIGEDHDGLPPPSLEDMINTLEELGTHADIFRTEIDTQEVGNRERKRFLGLVVRG